MRTNYRSGAFIDTYKAKDDKFLYDMQVVDQYGQVLFSSTNMSFAMVSEKISKYEKELNSERIEK